MIRKTLFAIAVSSLVALPAAAQSTRSYDERSTLRQSEERVIPRESARLRSAPEGSFITLTGRVVEAHPDGFVLDYGTGNVTVQMNDWDWYERDYRSLEGQRVTVQGRIDDNWTTRRSIDAQTVLASHTNRLYYAPIPGRAATIQSYEMLVPIADANTRIIGTVASIDPREREIWLESGGVEFAVNTDKLDFDPFSPRAPLRLNVGDRVIVGGNLLSPDPRGRTSADRRHELDATSLVLLTSDRKRIDANLARLEDER